MGLKKILADSSWAERRAPVPWLVGMTTFGILALELALIRWTSSQVRVFAYFNNLVLIGAFLGMGLGVALGRRNPGLVHFVLPVLLVLAVPLAFSESLGLVHLTFPDHTVALWGGMKVDANPAVFAGSLAVFLALFSAIVAAFVCAGAPLGFLFARLPVLRAYTADLVGSLLGIVAFALAAWLELGPAVWLALGTLPFAWVARRPVAALLALVVIGLAQYSVHGALFSAYNRIDLQQDTLWLELQVNRDFHQYLHDFSDHRMADAQLSPANRTFLGDMRDLYDLPFVVNPRRGSVLVVGAGTGNDAQAALRNGYRTVTSVDIDARIIGIGRERHPERPYSNPGVRTVVDDARSFFGKEPGTTYDLVCFGLLDSHAMSSAMSTLRLDNYVYTEEGIRAAWRHVGAGGHLSLAISCAPGRWFFDRLYWTITRATGREPVAIYSPLHGATATFLVARDGVTLDAAQLAKRTRTHPVSLAENVLTPSDDWPFLYVRPGIFPWGYVAVLAFVLALAVLVVPRTFAMGQGGGEFDGPLFLMGAAFLLIETRGVTSMSLLFGSTWVVNAAIFAGIVSMVLAANLAVQRWALRDPLPWFWALFAAAALLYVFPVAWLQTLPLAARAALAGFITALPVGFAGLIVPMLLTRAAQPVAALGSNLLGAVLGGCLEYYSMLGGLRSTALMALALYLGAFLWLRRRAAGPTAPHSRRAEGGARVANG
jgi:SAM-dependent methyltransferase